MLSRGWWRAVASIPLISQGLLHSITPATKTNQRMETNFISNTTANGTTTGPSAHPSSLAHLTDTDVELIAVLIFLVAGVLLVAVASLWKVASPYLHPSTASPSVAASLPSPITALIRTFFTAVVAVGFAASAWIVWYESTETNRKPFRLEEMDTWLPLLVHGVTIALLVKNVKGPGNAFVGLLTTLLFGATFAARSIMEIVEIVAAFIAIYAGAGRSIFFTGPFLMGWLKLLGLVACALLKPKFWASWMAALNEPTVDFHRVPYSAVLPEKQSSAHTPMEATEVVLTTSAV